MPPFPNRVVVVTLFCTGALFNVRVNLCPVVYARFPYKKLTNLRLSRNATIQIVSIIQSSEIAKFSQIVQSFILATLATFLIPRHVFEPCQLLTNLLLWDFPITQAVLTTCPFQAEQSLWKIALSVQF